MDDKESKLTLKVSIKDIEQFRMLLEILNRIMLDERIDKEIREYYLEEIFRLI